MRRHRGDVLLITIVFFAFVTLSMLATLNLSIEGQRSAAESVTRSIAPYNLVSVSDMAVDAALYDLATCSATVADSFVGETTDGYAEGLNAIQTKIFPVDTYWIDDITYLVEYEGLPESMLEVFSQASQGMKLEIILDGDIEIRNDNRNVLVGEDGDFAILAPVNLYVVITQGETIVQRVYSVDGLVAHFTHLTNGIYVSILGDDLEKQLISQTIK